MGRGAEKQGREWPVGNQTLREINVQKGIEEASRSLLLLASALGLSLAAVAHFKPLQLPNEYSRVPCNHVSADIIPRQPCPLRSSRYGRCQWPLPTPLETQH